MNSSMNFKTPQGSENDSEVTKWRLISNLKKNTLLYRIVTEHEKFTA